VCRADLQEKDDDDILHEMQDEWSEGEPFASSSSSSSSGDEQEADDPPHVGGAGGDVEEEDKDDSDDDAKTSSEEDEDDEDLARKNQKKQSRNERLKVLGDDDAQEDVIRELEREDAAVFMREKDMAAQHHKAKHVKHQKMIWERCLELQISIKRLISSMHVLSKPNDSDGANTMKIMQQNLAAKIRATMRMLHDIQQRMYTMVDFTATTRETTSSSSSRSNRLAKKRFWSSCDEKENAAEKNLEENHDDENEDGEDDDARSRRRMWASCEAESAWALPQYQSVLNQYSRQVEGGAKMKKLKVVNQDVLVQVDAVLADPERIRRKAHPVKDVVSSTCQADVLDMSMYDDREFYQQLLKEYIESGKGGAGVEAGALKLRRKRKLVNRRASKGRVIQYATIPKLQHFMFPDPTCTYRTNMDIDELFRSLFHNARSSAIPRLP
jgi:protein AATF/BFR2